MDPNLIIDPAVIAEEASRGSGQIASLAVSADVKKIKRGAFADCANPKRPETENGLACICEDAFAGCGALKEAVMPDSVRGVHAGAFRDCVSLERVVLPHGIRSVDKS